MQIGVESSRAVGNNRIFIVDDDEITRAVLQFMLHDENEAHELGSIEEAYAKGVDWKPNLTLMGVGIVAAKGPAAVADYLAHFPEAKLVIVADTADDATAKSAMDAGAHSILAKPLKVESVRAKVDTFLGLAVSIPLQVLK